MKRRSAILLSGALLCSMGVYVAWCFRPFYLPPPLKIVGDVSPNGREAVEEWRWADSYFKSPGFDRSMAWWNLCHPWDCREGEPVAVEEMPGCGLWATKDGYVWGFSKTRGRWDASTAHYHFRSMWAMGCYHTYHQGEIASRIETLTEDGATLEVLSLGQLTTLGTVLCQAGLATDGVRNSPSVFYDREVLGRITVDEPRARQRLVDGLTRSIREAAVDDDTSLWAPFKVVQLRARPLYYRDLPVKGGLGPKPEDVDRPLLDEELRGAGIVPRLGIIFTVGNLRAEYLVNFDDGEGKAFEDGIIGIGSYFRISSHAQSVFDDLLDKHGIERVKMEAR